MAQKSPKISDVIKECSEKLRDSVWKNSPKSRKLSVMKYCPLKIAKLSVAKIFYNKVWCEHFKWDHDKIKMSFIYTQ